MHEPDLIKTTHHAVALTRKSSASFARGSFHLSCLECGEFARDYFIGGVDTFGLGSGDQFVSCDLLSIDMSSLVIDPELTPSSLTESQPREDVYVLDDEHKRRD